MILTNDGLKFYSQGRLEDAFMGLGLPVVRYYRALRDRENNVWFATLGGGLQLIRQGERFEFKKQHGMVTDSAYALLRDDSDNFWFSCDYGIYSVPLKEFLLVADGKQDKVSAKGIMYGYTGSVLLLLFNLVMIQKPSWFGFADASMPSRLTFVLVGIWWLGFAQITFRRLPNNVYNKKP